MKQLLTFLILIFALHNVSTGQSFLKTYNYPQNATRSVTFECITPTVHAGNFYIAGHVGDSIALFKVNQSGNIITTRIITNAGSSTELDGIIYDNNNDIVVIGNYTAGQGFVFKFSTTSNTVSWFSPTNANDQIIFHDIVLIPGSNNYRIAATGFYAVLGIENALIVDANSSTGALSSFSHFKVNGVEDATAIQISGSQVYSTGRYAVGSGQSTFRPCLTRLNSTTAAHLGTKYYLVNKSNDARLYSTDMLMSGQGGVICGWGDDNGQNLYKNLYIIKVKSNGVLLWSRKYDNINAAIDGTFNTIRYNNGVQNYAVLGYTFTSSFDEAFIVYLDSSGNLLWSNKYPFFRHPGVWGENHQFVMSINNNYIFAVGEKSDVSGGITQGVLLKVPTSNGLLIDNTGQSCSDSLKFQVTPYKINNSVTPIFDTPIISNRILTVTTNPIKMSEQQICGITCTVNGVVDVSVPEICRGDSVTLYALGNSGVAPYTYLWSPSSSVVCPTCSTTVAHPTVTTNYQVTITDALGCSVIKNILVTVDTTCCVSCTLTTTVKTLPKGGTRTLTCGGAVNLVCNTNYGVNAILNCNGDTSSHITNEVLYDQNGNTPSWAALFLSTFGSGTLSIPNNVSGFYTLKYYWGISSKTCDSCSYTLEIACCGSFSVNAGPDIVKCTATVQLGVTVTNGASPYTYSWSPTTGLNNPNIPNPTCSTTGTYVVTVTDTVGCVKTDTVKIIPGGLGCQPIVQNMQQNKLKTSSNKLQVVPNPFTNSFIIRGLDNTASSLDILSADGKLIHRYKNISSNQNFGAQLRTGVYLVKIFYKDGSFKILKTIKQ